MPQANTNSPTTTFLNIYRILHRAFGPQYWWPGETPFEIIVGAILTQNTNWRNASSAVQRIKNAGLLEPRKMLKEYRRMPHLIRTSGFYRSKARYLRAFLRYYVGRYDGKVTNIAQKNKRSIRKELLTITGIGPETADSILLYALGRRTFVVDTYTRRILSRHGIIEHDLPYDALQKMIESNLPASAKIYNEFHALLVRAGKEYCRKNEPLCSTCPLGSILPGT
jgi:endonuclease-3 related protein